MALNLSNISEKLSQQFKDLIYTVYNQSLKKINVPYSHSSNVLLIDGFAGSVIVNMQRVTQAPKDTPFSGGPICHHIAEVFINPEDEQIAQVIEAHFKSQIIPPTSVHGMRPLFDRVIINGKEFKM